MATSSAALLLFFTALLSLSISSYSRPLPCNTLLISYSFTSYSSDSNSDSSSSSLSYRPSAFITVYRIISPFQSSSDFHRPSRPVQIQRPTTTTHLATSLQDRARDILAVAAGLLFGVGCGALTAATLYFLFAVATNRHVILGSHYDEDDDEIDEYDEIPSPKKGGYVTIPVQETADLKVKEGLEKN